MVNHCWFSHTTPQRPCQKVAAILVVQLPRKLSSLVMKKFIVYFFNNEKAHPRQSHVRKVKKYVNHLAFKYCETCSFVSALYLQFMNNFKNKTMEFMFTGINMFLALTQTHFSLSHQARVKMSSEKGPKIYLCPRTQTLLLLLSLWRALRKETLKKWQQNTPKNIFFTSAVRKCQRTLKWLLNFDWLLRSYDYLILTFYWVISY